MNHIYDIYRILQAMWETWQRVIPRADRPLRDVDAVCSLHFETHFIIQDFEKLTLPDGTEIVEPR